MNADQICQLLTELGCQQISVGSSGWVKATCPMARWSHRSGKDSHASFAVEVKEGGRSFCKCHACNLFTHLSTLVWDLSGKTGQDLKELKELTRLHNQPSEEQKSYLDKPRILPGSGKVVPKVGGVSVHPDLYNRLFSVEEPPPLDESELGNFEALPEEVYEYLRGRGLSADSIATWELGWHAGAGRISIPIRSVEQKLVGVSGRAWGEDQMPKFLHSTGFRRDFYLYGEHRIKRGAIRGYLCEGFFDVIYLQQHGYNAVAMMGTSPSQIQMHKMKKFFGNGVWIVLDGDGPGRDATEKCMATLRKNDISVFEAKIPDGLDPDELSREALVEILGPPSQLEDPASSE